MSTTNNLFSPIVEAIDCYQCDVTVDFYCGERFNSKSAEILGIVPKNCSTIHDAKYCVKTTGMFAGRVRSVSGDFFLEDFVSVFGVFAVRDACMYPRGI